MTTFYLLGNNGYSVQDTPEPEEWVKPLVAARLTRLEFFMDHLEPVFYETIVREKSEFYQAIVRTLAANRIAVDSFTTGRLLYLTNGLSHPFADARREAQRWLALTARTAAALGAPMIGGHYDYISLRDWRDPRAVQRMLDGMLAFAESAAREGIRAIALEQMYTPSLRPYTMADMEDIIGRLNERSAVPIYPMCDVGHMAVADPKDPAHTAADKDPCAWLARKYGGQDNVFVHLQQTDAVHSRHWPFIAARNAEGIISVERVIRAIESSGVARAWLSLEILSARGTPIDAIAGDIAASAEHVRGVLKKLGYAEEQGRFTRAG